MAQLDQTASRVKAPPMTDDAAELREYIKYLANIVAMLGKNLDYIINGNLDANNIRANSITANRMDVNELSAISANLGTIESGSVFGTYIATSHGFPRAELNVSQNLVAAMQDFNNYMAMVAQGTNNVPSLSWFSAGGIVGFLNRFINTTTLGTFDGENLNFQPSGNLQIGGQSGVGGGFWASSAPGAPADTFIAFTKGIRTS